MAEQSFDLREMETFYSDFHANVMEHGLWFCKTVADLSNDIMKDVLADFSLPYDVFRLQRLYAIVYSKIFENYNSLFLGRIFSVLEKNIVEEENIIDVITEKVLSLNIAKDISKNLAVVLQRFVLSYMKRYVDISERKNLINKYLVDFKKRVSEEVDLNINVTINFIQGNSDRVIRYLRHLYEKDISLDDLFGRCLFALVEDRYDKEIYLDQSKGIKYYYKEFESPFLSILERKLIGRDKYKEINEALNKDIAPFLDKNTILTKYTFNTFYAEPEFKKKLCKYLIMVLKKIRAVEEGGMFISLINSLLSKEGGGAAVAFLPQHFYVIVDCWVDFVGRHAPELLKREQVAQ